MTQPIQNKQPINPIALGAMRALIGFPVEHPMDMIKIASQGAPNLSSWKVCSEIYKSRGFRGFTEGALANFPRRVLKDSVRWPVIQYTHNKLIQSFPSIFTKEGTSSKVCAGLGVALFDSLVMLPFEQLMTYKIKENESYSTFFQKRFSKDGICSLYRGVGVNLAYRCTVWGTLMTINNEVKKKFSVYDKNNEHPRLREVVSSVLVATVLVAGILPMDFVKTRIQMDTDLQKMKVTAVVKTLVRRHGFSGFYAAAPLVWGYNVFYGLLFSRVLDEVLSTGKKS